MKRSPTKNNGSLQKLIDGLIDDLRSKGYTEKTLCNYRNRLKPIQKFMADNDEKSYKPDVGLRYYVQYMSNHSPCIEHQRAIKAAIRRLNDYCNNSGYAFYHSSVPALEISHGFMNSLNAYITDCEKKGNKRRTVIRKQAAIKCFLSRCASSNTFELSALSPALVLNACLLAGNKDDWADVRTFLSFIAINGFTKSDLSTFIPHFVREKKLPTVYSEEEIWAVENAVDRSTDIGKRDYAMLLLASRLGIRVGDIVHMRVDYLDFSNNSISFIQEKTGIPICLPMVPAVKEALLDYLQSTTVNSNNAVFESHLAPRQAIRGSAVSGRFAKYFRRAGIDVSSKKHGLHSLRSSLASSMVNTDIPYEAVRKILGHDSPNAISHYAKVDIEKLRRCAIEVPVPMSGLKDFLNGGTKYARV